MGRFETFEQSNRYARLRRVRTAQPDHQHTDPMKRTYRQLVLGLALCALVPVIAAGPGKVVERPHKKHGETVMIVDLSAATWDSSLGAFACPWSLVEVGVATHMGRYVAQGEGVAYFDAAFNPTGIITGQGSAVVANGDSIVWESPYAGYVTYLSGTGRFANVSGACTRVDTMNQVLEGHLLIITIRFTASGWISY
jgi:hypothetical protein